MSEAARGGRRQELVPLRSWLPATEAAMWKAGRRPVLRGSWLKSRLPTSTRFCGAACSPAHHAAASEAAVQRVRRGRWESAYTGIWQARAGLCRELIFKPAPLVD